MDQTLKLCPQYFGSLIFDPYSVRYFPFDQESTDLIIQLKDQSIFEKIEQSYGTPECEMLKRFFTHLDQFGLFSADGTIDANVLPIEPRDGYYSAPLVVHVEVIGACNITCTHCFAGELPRNENPLRVPEYDALFQELAAMGCFRVSLTGGEPLMHRRILEIVDSAISHGIFPAITTNGLLFDKELAVELGKRDSLRLTVSLDGATAESNDAVRGEGVFEKVCENLKILREHCRFSIGFSVTQENAKQAKDCVQLAKQLGASAAVFRPTYPVGNAILNPEIIPSFEQYVETLSQLSESSTLEEDVSELNLSCGAGNLLASISVQGNVSPCGFLGPSFAGGNIREKSFSAIWDVSKTFRDIRDASLDQKEGGYQGGCRARSQNATGDVHSADPWHSAHLKNPAESFFPLKNLCAEHE